MWIAHTDSETWRKHSLPKAREGTTFRDCRAVPVGCGCIWLLKDDIFSPQPPAIGHQPSLWVPVLQPAGAPPSPPRRQRRHERAGRRSGSAATCRCTRHGTCGRTGVACGRPPPRRPPRCRWRSLRAGTPRPPFAAAPSGTPARRRGCCFCSAAGTVRTWRTRRPAE